MIESSVFSNEPWSVTERELHLELLGQTESIFALSNGHIGLRGNLDEGEPHHTPGSYLNGFFESLPLPYAETGYGYPEEGQSVIDVTNGKLFRLLVDDEPFDVRYGTLREHRRSLNLRDGVLERTVEWLSPTGKAIRIRSRRLVSFVHRSVAAVRLEVEPLGGTVRVVLQSTLAANEPLPEQSADPRAAFALRAPLEGDYHWNDGLRVGLGHHTRSSGLRLAAGLDHTVDGPDATVVTGESWEDGARVTVSTELHPGQTLTVVKYLAYSWSHGRSVPALRDQVDAALASTVRSGWNGLVSGQRDYLNSVWDRADVEIDGNPQLQQAVRFALFQVIQAGARGERRPIPARGLTGRGYDGHTFWDMDTFTLPVLTYTAPDAARDALLWRYSTLELARERARELGLKGAAFPWRTISGRECSGYWPAGTAAFHINADIAEAVRRYVAASGDSEFEQGAGFEILIETARLWASLGHHDAEGAFRIDGVTGPDEYSALADNNTFTNLMAARNLREAGKAARRYPARACAFGILPGEVDEWLSAADAIVIPVDEELGITAQSEGFTRHRRWDFESTPAESYPLLLHYPYYRLYTSQVIKQADLVFALYLAGDHFSPEQKRRDFDYYEAITVRDSSLSACIQAIVAAEVGHLDLAYAYFLESASIDLRDLAGTTSDGLHIASLAGTWLIAVAGFGGLRDSGEVLSFAPRMPASLNRISFKIMYRGRCLRVDIGQENARYQLLWGDALEFLHHGERFVVSTEAEQTLVVPRFARADEVHPPPGREPMQTGRPPLTAA